MLVLLGSGVSIEIIVITDLVTHGVHHDIYTDNFIEFVDSKSTERLQNFEINVACYDTTKCQGECTQKLNPQLSERISVSLDAVLVSKNTDIKKTEEPANSMYLNCFNRVVNSVSFENLGCCEVAQSC